MIIKNDDLKDIILMMKRNSANIIEEIPQEEIDLYIFIQRQFNKQKSVDQGKNLKNYFYYFMEGVLAKSELILINYLITISIINYIKSKISMN